MPAEDQSDVMERAKLIKPTVANRGFKQEFDGLTVLHIEADPEPSASFGGGAGNWMDDEVVCVDDPATGKRIISINESGEVKINHPELAGRAIGAIEAVYPG